MLSKKKEPKLKKSVPAKQAKLEKNFTHHDNREKKGFKDAKYLEWFHQQGFRCLECETPHFIEAHHVHRPDDRTVVPFCSYCHRGDENQNRPIVKPYFSLALRNSTTSVIKGYFLHRGTESHAFSIVHPDSMLLQKARELYNSYLSEGN